MGCCLSKKRVNQQISNRNLNKQNSTSQKQPQTPQQDQLSTIRSPLTSSPIIQQNNITNHQDQEHQEDNHYKEYSLQLNDEQEKEFPSSKYELNPVTVSKDNSHKNSQNNLNSPASPGGTPYTPNGLDCNSSSNNDADNQSVLSITSSQARNLGPLIAARMKKKSNAMKKTIGSSKEVALRASGAHSSGGTNGSVHNSFRQSLSPESRAGYMLKQGKTFKSFKKYYFLLNNGILMSFENENDSLSSEKINDRQDKNISMEGYKLTSIQNKNHLVLEQDEEIYHAMNNDTNNSNTNARSSSSSSSRMSSFSMSNRGTGAGSGSGVSESGGGEKKRKHVFEIKDHTQYLLWQNAFQAHILYANLNVMDSRS